MFTALIALAAAALPAGTPSASPKAPARSETAVAGETDATAKPAAKRYCIVETPTGSILHHRDCRTREDWLAAGVDPLVKD